MLKMSLNSTLFIKNEADRAFQRWRGRTGVDKRADLGGYRGLILDLNDNCEDISEVLMKFRCRKCPQTYHLDQK